MTSGPSDPPSIRSAPFQITQAPIRTRTPPDHPPMITPAPCSPFPFHPFRKSVPFSVPGVRSVLVRSLPDIQPRSSVPVPDHACPFRPFQTIQDAFSCSPRSIPLPVSARPFSCRSGPSAPVPVSPFLPLTQLAFSRSGPFHCRAIPSRGMQTRRTIRPKHPFPYDMARFPVPDSKSNVPAVRYIYINIYVHNVHFIYYLYPSPHNVAFPTKKRARILPHPFPFPLIHPRHPVLIPAVSFSPYPSPYHSADYSASPQVAAYQNN